MRVFLDSLGCRLNQSEIEAMGREFRAGGHELVPTSGQSDLVVINTCSVTADAASTSRKRVRRAHRANPCADIVLTGCWSTLEPARASKLPGVKRIIPNQEKSDLVPLALGLDPAEFDLEPVERHPLPGLRMRTRAFIKAQDGCDHHCTYCLTTLARGPARSFPIEGVVRQVQAAVEGGAQEAVLSGVQLSGYGRDLPGQTSLLELVRAILADTDIPRLRLSSLEPWGLPGRFTDLWSSPRMCRQLHLPLQSGAAATLRRMGRPVTPEGFAVLVKRLRTAIPGLAVTSDVLVGFPGEDKSAFQESLDFVESIAFAEAHVFPYSPRPGTAALRLPDRVPPPIIKRRAAAMRDLAARSARAFRAQFVGHSLPVLWEAAVRLDSQGWKVQGLTDNYLRVRAAAQRNLWNQLSHVEIQGITDGELYGRILAPTLGLAVPYRGYAQES